MNDRSIGGEQARTAFADPWLSTVKTLGVRRKPAPILDPLTRMERAADRIERASLTGQPDALHVAVFERAECLLGQMEHLRKTLRGDLAAMESEPGECDWHADPIL